MNGSNKTTLKRVEKKHKGENSGFHEIYSAKRG
jgi:hypothetical protein